MPLLRILMVVLGTISLILGVIGIFVPLLPTTPFLLLTAFLYFKGSPRCYDWLMRQPHLGLYIRNFRENKVIPLKAKIVAVSLLWGSILFCVIFLIPIWWVKIILFVIAIGVTFHILSFKSK
jgi:uncharacterized membrane protein YbaN (DUF454 family)